MLSCNSKLDLGDEHDVTETGIVDQPHIAAVIRSEVGPWREITRGGDRIFVENRGTPDLGIYRFGRGDAQVPAAASRVGFALTGLAGWHDGDDLQIVSPNTGATLSGPEVDLSAGPAAGATELRGGALDWRATFAPAIDAGRGDTTWVTQMVGHTAPTAAGPITYRTLARAGIARGFTVVDRGNATLTAELAPVAEREVALRVASSQFARLQAEVGPAAGAAPLAAIAIRAVPDVVARRAPLFTSYYTGLPTVAEFGPLPATLDLDQTVRYGDPFATSAVAWSEIVTVAFAFPVPVPTPRAIGSISAMVVAAVPVDALAGGAAIIPTIGPVRGVQVAGQSLDEPRTGVGTAPTVTWQPPAIGAPTSYAVAVHAVAATEMGVDLTKVATLYTRTPSIAFPPGLLAPGGSYVLAITAIAADGADLAARPFVGGLPYAAADHITARFTP